MNTLKVNTKTKIFAETGSALDATEISKIKVEAFFVACVCNFLFVIFSLVRFCIDTSW
jgi:hypothetical protein